MEVVGDVLVDDSVAGVCGTSWSVIVPATPNSWFNEEERRTVSTSCTAAESRLLRQHVCDLSLACPLQSVPANLLGDAPRDPSLRTFIPPLTAQNDGDHVASTGSVV